MYLREHGLLAYGMGGWERCKPGATDAGRQLIRAHAGAGHVGR